MSNSTVTETNKRIYRVIAGQVSHPASVLEHQRETKERYQAPRGYASYYPHEGPIEEDPNFH